MNMPRVLFALTLFTWLGCFTINSQPLTKMTLTDIANHVCAQVGMIDTTDVAAAKEFAQRRLEMIWNGALWRTSLIEATMTLGTDGNCNLADTVWIPSRGTLLLPAAFNSVLAVRTDTNALSVATLESYYRTQANLLEMQGTPTEFQLLKPVVMEFDTVRGIGFTVTGDDSGDAFALTYSKDGITTIRASVKSGTIIPGVLSVLSASKPSGENSVTLEPAIRQKFAIPFTNSVPMPDAGSGAQGSISYGFYLASQALANSGGFNEGDYVLGSDFVAIGDGLTTSTTIPVSPLPFIVLLQKTVQSVGLPPAPPQIVTTWSVVASCAVPNNAVSAAYQTTDPDGGAGFTVSVLPADSSSTQALVCAANQSPWDTHQRIRLTLLPQASLNLRVLGKSECPVLGDYDSLPINNAESCLMAFIRADMLLRSRQHGKAQVAVQEATALLTALEQSETFQQANRHQICPENGFGANDDFIQSFHF